MDSRAQQIAIAEACGFTCDLWPGKKKSTIGWKRNGVYVSVLPDYPRDLNAMAEAEKTLAEDQRREYLGWLTQVVLPLYQTEEEYHWFALHATTAQRAEAFLHTIGKWTE